MITESRPPPVQNKTRIERLILTAVRQKGRRKEGAEKRKSLKLFEQERRVASRNKEKREEEKKGRDESTVLDGTTA